MAVEGVMRAGLLGGERAEDTTVVAVAGLGSLGDNAGESAATLLLAAAIVSSGSNSEDNKLGFPDR